MVQTQMGEPDKQYMKNTENMQNLGFSGPTVNIVL